MGVVQACFISVFGVLLALQFKHTKTEYGIYMGVAISIFIFAAIADKLSVVADAARRIQSYVQLNEIYIGILFKMLGITYIAEFACDLCKDAGYQTIASQISVLAKLTVLVLGMPVLIALLDTIEGFLI